MSQRDNEDRRLMSEDCSTLVEQLHERPLSLTSLPRAWQREIQALGSVSRGGAEHIFFAMLALVAYTLGCGAMVEVRMSGEDRFKASSNIIIAIVQASGGGKSPVVAWMFATMRKVSARIRNHFETEDIEAADGVKITRPPKLKNTFTLSTSAALISHLQRNTDRKHGGIILDEESCNTFPTIFDPVVVAKGATNYNYLTASDLLGMFDGTAIVADTKDAMKEGIDTDVEKHGMVAYLNAQPENVINSVRLAKDVVNLLGRVTFVFPPRRVVNPYDTERHGDMNTPEETRKKLLKLNSGKALCFECIPSSDKALEDGLSDTPIPGDFEEVLFRIFLHHRNINEPTKYEVEGEAYRSCIAPAFVINENITREGQSDYIARFAAKSNAKIAKYALLIHPLWHHYKRKTDDPACRWVPPPLLIEEKGVGDLALDIIVNGFASWKAMMKDNENTQHDSAAERIMLHQSKIVKGSDPKLRRFDSAVVQSVFQILHDKKLGKYTKPCGGHKYERCTMRPEIEEDARRLCEFYNVSFEVYKEICG